MLKTSAPLLATAIAMSTGCYAVKVTESIENVDTLLKETPRQEYTGDPQLVHNVEASGTVLTTSTKIARPCARWTEAEVHRIEHTSRTLMSPDESSMRGLLLYGGLAIAGGVGYGVYGATSTDRELTGSSYVLTAAGVGIGGVLIGNWIQAKSRSKDTQRDLGTIAIKSERVQGACDEEPLAATKIEMPPFGLEKTTTAQGSWTLDIGSLEEGSLRNIASNGLVVKATAGDHQYVSSMNEIPVRDAAGSELRRREAERAALEAEEAAKAKAAALASLPTNLKRYNGPWKLSTEQSPVDDSLTIIATRSANSTISGWPNLRSRPLLTLRCMQGRPEAFIHTGFPPQVEQHNYSMDLATTILRLDKEQAVKVLGSKSSTGEALFLPNPEEFMQQLVEHESLYFQFTPFNSNPAETTFTLSGVDEVVGFIRLGCDW